MRKFYYIQKRQMIEQLDNEFSSRKNELKESLRKTKQEIQDAKIAIAINQALANGKLAPSDVDIWLTTYKDRTEELFQALEELPENTVPDLTPADKTAALNKAQEFAQKIPALEEKLEDIDYKLWETGIESEIETAFAVISGVGKEKRKRRKRHPPEDPEEPED
jgi:chromosome segregation ATPase